LSLLLGTGCEASLLLGAGREPLVLELETLRRLLATGCEAPLLLGAGRETPFLEVLGMLPVSFQSKSKALAKMISTFKAAFNSEISTPWLMACVSPGHLPSIIGFAPSA